MVYVYRFVFLLNKKLSENLCILFLYIGQRVVLEQTHLASNS